ncbi:hypothetical protein Leryth_018739 [Lithospermum erythrorhizon]|nr:hypothetical protein Leryth_018739 [Lithospermum erythrorhizon]
MKRRQGCSMELLSAKQHSRSSESKWRSRKDSSSDPYARFISALYSLLDGSSDKAKFEDNCRAIVGNQSYVLFTLDKLIYKLIKQLQIENIYHFGSSSSPMSLSIQLVNEGNEKTDLVSVAMDPNFAAYLYNDYLSVSRGKKESSAVILKSRNMRRYATLEESDAPCMATENVVMVNGLECKMAAFSSKISYVLDTEDFFCRFKRKKRASTSGSSWWNQAKVQHFREFLATNL